MTPSSAVARQLRQFRQLRRLGRDDSGISLVELIVAIALTAVISTLLVTIVVTVSRTFVREAQAATNSDSASVGMRELSRVIRGAVDVTLAGSAGAVSSTAIVSASAHQLTLYSFIDADVGAPTPVTVQFVVAPDGTLSETRWAGSATAPSTSTATTVWQFVATPTSQRVIVRGVPSATATPLFTYYSAAGTELPVPTSGVLDAPQREAIAAVKVTLRVQQTPTSAGAPASADPTSADPTSADPISIGTAALIENTIGLPNLGISRVGSTP